MSIRSLFTSSNITVIMRNIRVCSCMEHTACPKMEITLNARYGAGKPLTLDAHRKKKGKVGAIFPKEKNIFEPKRMLGNKIQV